jgi:hypothetical protein
VAPTAYPIDDSQRTAAKVAGLACLLAYAIVIFAEFAIRQRLMVAGDTAQTIRNIAAAERLYRAGLTLNLAFCVGTSVLATALYVILRPVSRHLALLAASWRLLYVVTSVLMVLNMLAVAQLAGASEYPRLLEAGPLQGLVLLSNRAIGDQYYVGLAFWALASAACSWLWLRSRYIPAVLAGLGLISSIWCTVCTVVYLIDRGFANTVNLWWFDSPMAVFELALSVWLLVRGLPRPEAARA